MIEESALEDLRYIYKYDILRIVFRVHSIICIKKKTKTIRIVGMEETN